jgi:hypothetical protein
MIVIADGGYSFSFDDGTSTVCALPSAFCATGSTAAADTMGKNWGAGVGVNLNQAMATGSSSPPVNAYAVPTTAKGISYGLSNLPTQGGRIVIDNGGTDYCSTLQAASAQVTWAKFNTKCWDNSGTALSAPPATATHIEFEVDAVTAATPFDFCVTAIGFM